MQVTIPVEELRKRSLFVATPMYGGMCAGMFCKSTNDLSSACIQYGINLRYYYLFNESLITRARNYCCDEFMRSDCSHLMFIDADIGFDAQSVLTLMALQSEESDYDVICAPYAKKILAWEKIKHAVDKGVADADPHILEQFVGDYVFNPVPGMTSFRIDEPVEVLEAGTGFMMIKRSTFEKFRDNHPDRWYRPDHVRTAAFDGSREIMQYFQAEIDQYNPSLVYEKALKEIGESSEGSEIPQKIANDVLAKTEILKTERSKRYLSEDYLFCQDVRRLGMKVWMCPWLQLQHVGSYVFGGSLAAIASIGASPTADPSKLLNKK